MTDGLKIRSDIDTENVKGLLLINGGAAVALLTFLPNVFGKVGYESLSRSILWGLLIFQFGLIFAIAHNRLRRKCSLIYESHNYAPPACKIVGFELNEPCLCSMSWAFMWLSVFAFFLGGISVACGGFESLKQIAVAKQEVTTVPPAKQIELSPKTIPHGTPIGERK
jgi:hypothetical protein